MEIPEKMIYYYVIWILYLNSVMISSTDQTDCTSLCKDGPDKYSVDCFVMTGCDITFPAAKVSIDDDLHTVEIDFKSFYTTYTSNFVYKFDPVVHRTSLSFGNGDLFIFNASKCEDVYYDQSVETTEADANLTIFKTKLEDAGEYNVTFRYSKMDGEEFDQCQYHLFLFHPSTSLQCVTENLSFVWPGSSPTFYLTCTVQAFPPVEVDIISNRRCFFRKSKFSGHPLKTVTAVVTLCEDDVTFSCVARYISKEFPLSLNESHYCKFETSRHGVAQTVELDTSSLNPVMSITAVSLIVVFVSTLLILILIIVIIILWKVLRYFASDSFQETRPNLGDMSVLERVEKNTQTDLKSSSQQNDDAAVTEICVLYESVDTDRPVQITSTNSSP